MVSESFAVSDCFLLISIVLRKSIPYAAMRRLMRELKELRTSPPEGIRVQLSEESVLDVVGIVEGPGACRRVELWDVASHDAFCLAEGTPYERGYFRVKFEFTEEYPAAPPKCKARAYLSLCLPTDVGGNLCGRSVHDEDFPSECVEHGRDLREHAQKGLEGVVWDRAHPRDHQVPPHLPESRLGAGRRGGKAAAGEL